MKFTTSMNALLQGFYSSNCSFSTDICILGHNYPLLGKPKENLNAQHLKIKAISINDDVVSKDTKEKSNENNNPINENKVNRSKINHKNNNSENQIFSLKFERDDNCVQQNQQIGDKLNHQKCNGSSEHAKSFLPPLINDYFPAYYKNTTVQASSPDNVNIDNNKNEENEESDDSSYPMSILNTVHSYFFGVSPPTSTSAGPSLFESQTSSTIPISCPTNTPSKEGDIVDCKTEMHCEVNTKAMDIPSVVSENTNSIIMNNASYIKFTEPNGAETLDLNPWSEHCPPPSIQELKDSEKISDQNTSHSNDISNTTSSYHSHLHNIIDEVSQNNKHTLNYVSDPNYNTNTNSNESNNNTFIAVYNKNSKFKFGKNSSKSASCSSNTKLNSDLDDIMKKHILEDISTRFYFSYRKSIPPDQYIGDKYSSDRGWGCLIRSGQMLLAEALLRLHLGRKWRKHFLNEKILQEYVSEFPDTYFLSKQEKEGFLSQFSYRKGKKVKSQDASQNEGSNQKENAIENISHSKPKKKGSWVYVSNRREESERISITEHELNQIAIYNQILYQFFDARSSPFSIQRICEHAEFTYGIKVGEWFAPTYIAIVFRDLLKLNHIESALGDIYICEQSAIYLDDIEAQFGEEIHNIDRAVDYTYNEDFQGKVMKSDKYLAPFLLLIPTKLGINNSNQIYEEVMKKVLECPYSVGIAGGKRNHSLYFYGYDKNSFLYFDPHTTQQVSKDLNSYHLSKEKPIQTIKFSQIDPSMLLGFLIRNRDEWNDFLLFAKQNFCLNDAPILSILPTKPTFDIHEGEEDEEWQTLCT